MEVQAHSEKIIAVSIGMSIALVAAAMLSFLVIVLFPQTSIWVENIALSAIDFGFLVSIFLGFKIKKISVVLFSILANGLLFLVLTLLIFILALTNGVSTP